MRNFTLILSMGVAAATSSATGGPREIAVTGWKTPGNVMTYTADGLPLHREPTRRFATIAGRHAWNRTHDIVELDGGRWVERTTLALAYCRRPDCPAR